MHPCSDSHFACASAPTRLRKPSRQRNCPFNPPTVLLAAAAAGILYPVREPELDSHSWQSPVPEEQPLFAPSAASHSSPFPVASVVTANTLEQSLRHSLHAPTQSTGGSHWQLAYCVSPSQQDASPFPSSGEQHRLYVKVESQQTCTCPTCAFHRLSDAAPYAASNSARV